MNCEQVKELLSAYLDNELAPQERRDVAAHLQECSVCCGVLADYRRFDALLSGMPRVSPSPALREQIFSSPAYLELTGTFASRTKDVTVPYRSVRRRHTDHPRLVALPGGRDRRRASPPRTSTTAPTVRMPVPARDASRRRHAWVLRAMRLAIAAAILLTVGIGSLIGWNLWHQQGKALDTTSITPPADLQQGPLPAGIRFIFQRNGALWSAPADGGMGPVRLTASDVTVAERWTVRPALSGSRAGNMLAYIDLQQGYVHVLRSDGQNDTIIRQPLLKPGTHPSAVWDTSLGASILNSLSWSPDGSMLAFVSDAQGTGLPALYIYSTRTDDLQQVALSAKGGVAHPVWSPDSARVAFTFAHDGKIGILDYNVHNRGLLTIAPSVSSTAHPDDTVLALEWAANTNAPTLTWSVGSDGQVHSLWQQRVGLERSAQSQLLISGDYVEAHYSQRAHQGAGSWLLITAQAGDVISVDHSARATRLTQGKKARAAQWSPNGAYIAYFAASSADIGELHIIDTTAGSDTLIAPSVARKPAPAWSPDSQHLIYTTGTHILSVDSRNSKVSHPLKIQGSPAAFSWSAAAPDQLVLALNDDQQGIYLLDIQHDTALQLDKESMQEPIMWTQVP